MSEEDHKMELYVGVVLAVVLISALFFIGFIGHLILR